ncbi:MAG: quinone oxidoreductase family protein [Streptosporangiaceae bacterium]
MSPVVVAAAYGGPEVLTHTDEQAGVPGPGQALIEIRAAGVNPIDYKMYSGAYGRDPSALPIRLGYEASGVVIAAGQDAAGPVRPGDEVIAYRVSGAYAGELIADAAALVPKPATLDWAPAAGLMLAGATAWHCLDATGVTAGDTVLLHGAAGGVGIMAIQLAIARGAAVLATGSPASLEFLHELGATAVTYGPGLAGRIRDLAPGGIAAALDLAGTDEAVDVSLELVADRARIATIAAPRRAGPDGFRALGNGPGADPGTQIRMAARTELAAMAGDGTLRVIMAGTCPLAEAAQAHRAIMAGHTHGKIALIL